MLIAGGELEELLGDRNVIGKATPCTVTRANKHEIVPFCNAGESLTQQSLKLSVVANILLLF